MPPTEAAALYEHFVATLRGMGYQVGTGRFGAMMAVELCNDGPVTIWLDSSEARRPRPAADARPEGG
jgi:D-tyrosyl-tRNA(Tyr) deacylase